MLQRLGRQGLDLKALLHQRVKVGWANGEGCRWQPTTQECSNVGHRDSHWIRCTHETQLIKIFFKTCLTIESVRIRFCGVYFLSCMDWKEDIPCYRNSATLNSSVYRLVELDDRQSGLMRSWKLWANLLHKIGPLSKHKFFIFDAS
jgi:hypothetical protein